MALLTCSFYSKALKFRTKIEVYLPQPDRESPPWTVNNPSSKFPVLYLLHGYSNDENEWTRFSTFGQYIEDYPVVVVMPSLQRSTYVDISSSHRYWTYLSEELPAIAQSFFPISDLREDTFVAGISMGGYGAFKLGLTFPERYAAAASFIGVLNLHQESVKSWWKDDVRLNFGENTALEGGPHDLFHLARQMAALPGPKTRLYACTGTEDFVYDGNRAFKSLAESLGLDLTYADGPGDHSWSYVDPMIPRMLAWLRLQPYSV
jgi:putative tributyrin esterase